MVDFIFNNRYVCCLIFCILGYLCGSLMFAYWIPKWLKHIDTIQEADDGNPGATNAFKNAGIHCGIVCLLLDMAKGAFPVYLSRFFVEENWIGFSLIMVTPLIGHAFPIYQKFHHGGKCIATSFGVLIGLFPDLKLGFSLATWYILFSTLIIIKPHALRTIITYGGFVVTSFFFITNWFILIGCACIAAIVVCRHLKSLKESEERKIQWVFRQ